MDKFLFFNIVITILNIFLIVYAYSLNFFPKKWRKKVNQDTIVGLALIFLTMFTGFLWVFYYYYKLIFQARYRWEIAPLSDLFLVYTRGSDLPSQPRTHFKDLLTDTWSKRKTDSLIVKLRYRLGN